MNIRQYLPSAKLSLAIGISTWGFLAIGAKAAPSAAVLILMPLMADFFHGADPFPGPANKSIVDDIVVAAKFTKESLQDTATLTKNSFDFIRKHGFYGTLKELREGCNLIAENSTCIMKSVPQIVKDNLKEKMQTVHRNFSHH